MVKIIISHTALQNTIPNVSRLCPSKKSVTGYAKIIEPEIKAEITKANKNIKIPAMRWAVTPVVWIQFCILNTDTAKNPI